MKTAHIVVLKSEDGCRHQYGYLRAIKLKLSHRSSGFVYGLSVASIEHIAHNRDGFALGARDRKD